MRHEENLAFAKNFSPISWMGVTRPEIEDVQMSMLQQMEKLSRSHSGGAVFISTHTHQEGGLKFGFVKERENKQ